MMIDLHIELNFLLSYYQLESFIIIDKLEHLIETVYYSY